MKALLKLVAILALCVFSIAALSGCGKQEPNIVGTYKYPSTEYYDTYITIKKDPDRENYYLIRCSSSYVPQKVFFVNKDESFKYNKETNTLIKDNSMSNDKFYVNKDGKELKNQDNYVCEKISDKILPTEELNKNNYSIKDKNIK